MERFYPIGTPGQPWTDNEKQEWFRAQQVQRSYLDDVRTKLNALGPGFDVEHYGALPLNPNRYPLFAVRIPAQVANAPSVLITGGVHGYETSGVQGALRFLESTASKYRDRFSLVVVPCVSPWGYEVINRWNPSCVDPNRSFHANSPSEEAALLMRFVKSLGVEFIAHLDLHETTDSDEDEFRPAASARDGVAHDPGSIPDGFYTVGDTANPQAEFQAAIVAGVAQVTHIAPADEADEIIGSPVAQPGVINYPFRELGLCAGITGAAFTTTTEVYPDSANATPEICVEAQMAALVAGLDFVLERT